MMGDDTVFLSDGEMYDLIVDVVGDETSLEFCTLSSYYIDDNDLDTAMRAHMTDWKTVQTLIDDIEELASKRREAKRADGGSDED